MKIISQVNADDCIGDSFIKDCRLNDKITLDFIGYLGKIGNVTVLDGIKNPFFSFDMEYMFSIKGLIGQKNMKVIYRLENMDAAKGVLEHIIENYDLRDVDSSVASVKGIEKAAIEAILLKSGKVRQKNTDCSKL